MLASAELNFILRNDLMSFTERAFYEVNSGSRLLLAPYIELITSKLEAVRLGKIKRLIINLPPRSLKSHCASVAFPAWCLGHDPTMQIICVSYGQDLADKHARDCRNVMRSSMYKNLFATRLSERKAVYDFETTAGGNRMATSVGGVITGRGADIIIMDDIIKPEEAMSETSRNRGNDWYSNTLATRHNDKVHGATIILMQRLHQDDLCGHCLQQGGWEVLSIPAIAVQDECHIIDSPLGRSRWRRRRGEALHEEREPLAKLLEIRDTIGDYNFAAQYQQNPIPIGGAIVKTEWLQYYGPDQRPSRFTLIIQSWDTANKASDLNDFSVGTTWGIYDGHYYLLDVFRKRLNYPDLKRAVKEHAQRFDANEILIEDKASGTQLIQDLQHELIMGVRPYKAPPNTDKIMRLHAQTAKFESGKVLLPRYAPWLFDYVAELTGFPGTRYDDQVDSTTQVLDYLNADHGLEVWIKLGGG